MRLSYLLYIFLLLELTSAHSEDSSLLFSVQLPKTAHRASPRQYICELIRKNANESVVYLGHYEESILFQAQTRLLGAEPYTQTLGAYDPSRYAYFVLEHQKFEVETQDNIAWEKDIVALVIKMDIKMFHISERKLLVVLRATRQRKLLSALPLASIVISVSPKTIACSAKDHVSKFKELAKLHAAPEPRIKELVDKVSQDDLRFFAEYLSGEASNSDILTRNSLSEGAIEASKWILSQFASFGFTTSIQNFRPGYSDNVVAVLPGDHNNTEIIVIGAHYDSRASNSTSPTERAPGANDDGSGTSTLLQIAKIIHDSKVQLLRTIHIVAFGGEEQGLLGSQAYAKQLAGENADVFAMLQADMIAYRKPGSPALLGFPQRFTTPDLTLLAITAANTYAPGVSTGRNDRCCSDHRSFFELGYPATDFSDTHGPITDPFYHNSGDLVNREGFSLEQLAFNAQAMFATLLVLAEPQGR